MTTTRPKAADITDEQLLRAVLEIFEANNAWAYTWELDERFAEFPPKVVQAKAAKLIKRNMLQGCTCGCRGDFELQPKGMDYLHTLGIAEDRLTRYSVGRAIGWHEGLSDRI